MPEYELTRSETAPNVELPEPDAKDVPRLSNEVVSNVSSN